MKRTSKKVVLTGSFCLPTSTKAHIHEPVRGNAFKPGQISYILAASQSIEDGGYPPAVVLTTDEALEGFEVGAAVATQHAEVRKNLPPRYVAAVVQADGTVEGDASFAPRGLGLPHWEFIPTTAEGGASVAAISAVKARIEGNKAAAEAAKEAVRTAKKGAAPAATTTTASAE